MTPLQLREARVLLGLSQEQLADMADLSLWTIEDVEAGRLVHPALIDAVHVTLEAAGAEFVPENDGCAGVRLNK